MAGHIDPTSEGDRIAAEMRAYYEAHRESWWERRFRRWEFCADNLMLGLMNVAIRERDKRN